MLVKNPAGKLAVPKSGKRVSSKHLTPEQIPQILFHLTDRDRLIVRMFLVLGLRPGEMFALRWNDKQDHSLRIDSSISSGIEVETKTEGSDSAVWLPGSIEVELEFWRGCVKNASPEAFIFPSARGTAIRTDNFLFRVLKEAGKNAGIAGVNHQVLRRTCSTYMAQITSVKDVQAHLRHTSAQDDARTLHQVRTGKRPCGCGIARLSVKIGGGSDGFSELNPFEPDFGPHSAAS